MQTEDESIVIREEPVTSDIPRMTSPPLCAGFTLIELSIVLVVIGLLVGGVLVGRDLIRTAELRAVISERESFQTATQSFRLKYNALPGDFASAESIWGSDANCPNTPANNQPKTETCNGNGDGKVADALTGSPDTQYESARYWQHLAAAGLVHGAFTGATGAASSYTSVVGVNVPESTLGGKTGYAVLDLGNPASDPLWGLFYFPGHYGPTYHFGKEFAGLTYGAALTPGDAYVIDAKIDDGRPGTGSVMTIKPPTMTCASSTLPETATYLLDVSDQRCMLLFLRAF